jgi:hypothetical protein
VLPENFDFWKKLFLGFFSFFSFFFFSTYPPLFLKKKFLITRVQVMYFFLYTHEKMKKNGQKVKKSEKKAKKRRKKSQKSFFQK